VSPRRRRISSAERPLRLSSWLPATNICNKATDYECRSLLPYYAMPHLTVFTYWPPTLHNSGRYIPYHSEPMQYLRQFKPIADIPSRQRLRSSSSDDLGLLVPAVRLSILLDVAPSLPTALAHGTTYRTMSAQHPLFSPSENDENCTCFDFHILA